MGLKWIVVADDNDAIRQMVRDALEPHGYEVHEASNGLDALVRIEEVQADLVVMDLQMPALTGLEATQWLRRSRRYRDLKIIAFSADVTPESEKRLLAVGFDACVPKGVKLSVLRSVVDGFFVG